MRRLSAAFILVLVSACTGGASPTQGPGGSTNSTNSTTPTEESGGAARPSDGICGEYIACIAKKAPEMLDTVTDAYGKSGSCWGEMSAEACENACAAGKTRTKCDVCDLASGTCLGESCAPQKKCPLGEACAKGKCIEDAREACGESANGAGCPAPYECIAAGDGYGCALACTTNSDCPALSTCGESGYCWY